jgi:hypothetical protein
VVYADGRFQLSTGDLPDGGAWDVAACNPQTGSIGGSGPLQAVLAWITDAATAEAAAVLLAPPRFHQEAVRSEAALTGTPVLAEVGAMVELTANQTNWRWRIAEVAWNELGDFTALVLEAVAGEPTPAPVVPVIQPDLAPDF